VISDWMLINLNQIQINSASKCMNVDRTKHNIIVTNYHTVTNPPWGLLFWCGCRPVQACHIGSYQHSQTGHKQAGVVVVGSLIW